MTNENKIQLTPTWHSEIMYVKVHLLIIDLMYVHDVAISQEKTARLKKHDSLSVMEQAASGSH
jgi:hypothetical protein